MMACNNNSNYAQQLITNSTHCLTFKWRFSWVQAHIHMSTYVFIYVYRSTKTKKGKVNKAKITYKHTSM